MKILVLDWPENIFVTSLNETKMAKLHELENYGALEFHEFTFH